jgi:hypothetical protein
MSLISCYLLRNTEERENSTRLSFSLFFFFLGGGGGGGGGAGKKITNWTLTHEVKLNFQTIRMHHGVIFI